MSPEKIVLVFALLGSVAWLGETAIRLFGYFVAKRTTAINQANAAKLKALEEAKMKAQTESAQAAHDSIISLMQAVKGMQKAFGSVAQPSAESANNATQAQATAPSTPAIGDVGEGATIEQKVAILASTVGSQAEQLEAIQASLRMLVESMGPQAPKRRAPRKGGDESGLSRASSTAARAAKTPVASGHSDDPSIEGLLDGMPPVDKREGEFEVVK